MPSLAIALADCCSMQSKHNLHPHTRVKVANIFNLGNSPNNEHRGMVGVIVYVSMAIANTECMLICCYSAI